MSTQCNLSVLQHAAQAARQHGSTAELRIVDGAHDWDLWRPLFEEGMQVMARELPPYRVSPTGCSMPAT